MYKLIRPILFWFDPEASHNAMHALGFFLSKFGAQDLLRPFFTFDDPALQVKFLGIDFKNPLGAAAGFDKHGKLLDFLPALGVSHLQIGDVSNLPSPGNPRPRLFRLPKDRAIINRMGQDNRGADAIASLLRSREFTVPVTISLVKTPDPAILEDKALADFVACFRKLYAVGNISVLNISCPNTADGRTFEEPTALNTLLDEIMAAKRDLNLEKPIVVKISPDVSLSQLDQILQICEAHGISGYILTNTSTKRDGLKTSPEEIQKIGRGGLSGLPIRDRSTELIRHAYKQLQRPCIIGLGGVDSAEAAYAKIKAGASLVQLFTGLVYEGPGLVKKIKKGLVELLKKDGFENISQAVGASHR